MGDQRYDVTLEQKEILLERARRRTFLRNEFQKQLWDPNRHAEGGSVFDPAIQRFMAMKATQYDHFKATPKTVRLGILGMLLPIIGYAYILNLDRTKREKKFRNGEVAYKDRLFKFI